MRLPNQKELLKYNHAARSEYAEKLVEQAFLNAGWKIVRNQKQDRDSNIDFVIEQQDTSYLVEVKIAPEGRTDRLIPVWSQAYLIGRSAESDRKLLVVVVAPKIGQRAIDQLFEFAEHYAPDAAVGIIDFEGLQVFRGQHLDDLNSINKVSHKDKNNPRSIQINLFSDLNQWMIKVLLAPSIRKDLLAAPRAEYENASQLAKSANVSVMSAFRFVDQLRREGYFDETSRELKLVRKKDLLNRWLSASAKPVKEIPVKFILRVDPNRELKRVLHDRNRCLALFAAAEALGVGFVHGVPPYIYVRRIDEAEFSNLGNVREADKGEAPDLILRESKVPESVFRGMVKVNGIFVADILQIWLDVSSHPSRGFEQAKFIEERLMPPFGLDS